MTIKDIAKICNVSTGTVNRALNGKYGINPETKAKILEVVRELNYQPNYHARTLATGKTNTIGLVLPNVDNEFFAMVCSGIEQLGWESGYVMNLVLSNDDPEKQNRALTSFLERGVDGIIVFPASTDTEILQRIVRTNTKVVLLLNDLPLSDLSIVKVNDFDVIARTVGHLTRRGHRRIAYIDGYTHYSDRYNDSINRERYRGYREALVRSHIMYERDLYLEFNPDWYDGTDFQALASLVGRSGGRPTAIVCFHDQIAIWAMQGLEHLGLSVPVDVSVTGVDNIRELKHIHPRLTTSDLRVREIARLALAELIRQIETPGTPPQRISLDAELIEGESVRDAVLPGAPSANDRTEENAIP